MLEQLKEVLAKVEALKKDLEDLGIDVNVTVSGVTRGGMKGPSVTVISLVLPDLKKMEAEG